MKRIFYIICLMIFFSSNANCAIKADYVRERSHLCIEILDYLHEDNTFNEIQRIKKLENFFVYWKYFDCENMLNGFEK